MSNESDEPVYFDDFKVTDTRGRIIEENHYYAFGLKIAGISSTKLGDPSEGSLKNSNLYNDKELFEDADLNWYDYGFRNYDAQIGRFPQLDPLTDDYPYYTPYQYAGNEPIANVDLDGLEPIGSTIGSAVGDAVVSQASFLKEVVVAGLKKVAPVVKSSASAFGKSLNTALKAVGSGVTSFAKGLWNEGVVPTVDWVNHNVNPVYNVFNGLNSQFTGKDFLNGKTMTREEGFTDAILPFVPFGKLGGIAEKTLFRTVEKALSKGGGKLLKFESDAAIAHFGEHASEIMKVMGKNSYNLKNYLSDANWIIRNGTYSSKLNGYYYYIRNAAKGESLFGFVGLKNGGKTISTFHIKNATQLGLK